MPIKKIPRHAETSFGPLCAEYGATCNKSDEDERGWDFFVQFPHSPGSERLIVPPDMRPDGYQCLVQIKSTSRRIQGVSLKVSNAMAFARNPTPCFVVLFPYADGLTSEDAYLLHFWDTAISRTLRKARELDAQGRSDLHRTRIRFARSEMKKVRRVDLLSTIESAIDQVGPNYGQRKQTYAETVGFSEGGWTGTVSVQAEISDIVDMNLGLRDRLPLNRVSVRSVRFGLESGKPVIDTTEGYVSFRSNPKKCVVTISSEPDGREVSLPCELYSPAFPGLAKEHVRFRIVHPFLEMILHQGKDKADFKIAFTGDESVSLSEIENIVRISQIFSSPRLHFRVNVDGNPLIGGTCTIKDVPRPRAVDLVGIFIEFINANTKPHDIPDSLRVTMRQLIKYVDRLEEFNALAIESTVTANVTFDLNANIPPFTGKALLAPYVELGDHSIYAIVKRNVEMAPTGIGKIDLALGAIDSARIRILTGSHVATAATIEREVEVYRRNANDERLIVFPWRTPDCPVTVRRD